MVTYREENKILLKDLNSISDPSLHQYFQNEQLKFCREDLSKAKYLKILPIILVNILMILEDLIMISQVTK